TSTSLYKSSYPRPIYHLSSLRPTSFLTCTNCKPVVCVYWISAVLLLRDRVAIVTGASRGIGFWVARSLVDAGAKVVITARKPDPLAEAVEQLGGEAVALGVPGKADDVDHQDGVVERAPGTCGRTDFLANHTG